MNVKRIVAIVLSLLLVLGSVFSLLMMLTACSAPSPSQSASPTPVLTPTPEAPEEDQGGDLPEQTPQAPVQSSAGSLSPVSANNTPIESYDSYDFTEDEVNELLAFTNNIPFPDFSLSLLNGEERVSLDDYKGKVLVVNAMASWCGYCVMELPYFAEAASCYSEDEVAFLGFQTFENTNDAGDALRKELDNSGVNFPVAIDEGDEVGLFMSPRGSIPVTLIIDRQGIVRIKREGAFPSADALTPFIDFVLGYENLMPAAE